MFSKILIANRGEIACRVIRTAKALNIKTVAVYSEADANAPHVRHADEAILIGGPASSDSYLRIDKLIDVALDTGAEAIHPGYGFLSENAEFVEAVQKAGLAFIGPDVHAIKVMGDKIESKALAEGSGVSCVPGTKGAVSDTDEALAAAADIGYPVMVKASAGGGGKGMRVVASADELPDGMRAAMTEAKNAFGDDRVFIEKFVIYLGERECSVQRRHQKVIEEAPSPFISDKTRKAMGEQAVMLARAVNYRSAGTVEFIVGANQDFYFLEMNTRLQVEHPVTEEVYGLDLVEWMLRIAAGETLTITQGDVRPQNWSIEARLYAEDSSRGFLPSIGQLRCYHEPQGPGIRVDAGISEGGTISMFYDPMISKLIATAPTRPEAIDRLILALDQYQIFGVSTNRQFLAAILSDADFRKGDMTTGFIAGKFGDSFVADAPDDKQTQQLMALGVALHARRLAARHHGKEPNARFAVCRDDDEGRTPHLMQWHADRHGDIVTCDDHDIRISGNLGQAFPQSGHIFDGEIDGDVMAVQVEWQGWHYALHLGAKSLHISLYPEAATAILRHLPVQQQGHSATVIPAPMPGLLTRLMVAEGDIVEAGQNVAIIEAMKMENVLKAEMKGIVSSISAAQGDSLNVDDVIITLAELDETK
jgi:propionyl-CoA carboxylase alpha chain